MLHITKMVRNQTYDLRKFRDQYGVEGIKYALFDSYRYDDNTGQISHSTSIRFLERLVSDYLNISIDELQRKNIIGWGPYIPQPTGEYGFRCIVKNLQDALQYYENEETVYLTQVFLNVQRVFWGHTTDGESGRLLSEGFYESQIRLQRLLTAHMLCIVYKKFSKYSDLAFNTNSDHVRLFGKSYDYFGRELLEKEQ